MATVPEIEIDGPSDEELSRLRREDESPGDDEVPF
jgi:hypothetical protein